MYSHLDTAKKNAFLDYVYNWAMKPIFDAQFPSILDIPWIDKRNMIKALYYAYNISKIAPYIDDSYFPEEKWTNTFLRDIIYTVSKKYARYEDFENEIQKITTLSEGKKEWILSLALEQFAKGIKESALPWQVPLNNEDGLPGSNREWWEKIALKINPDWITLNSWRNLSLEEKQRYIIYISRNFLFEWKTEKDVTRETVGIMITAIEQTRNLYGDLPIFSGRNVLFTANWEIPNDETKKVLGVYNKFGQQVTQDSIRQQSWSYSFVRPDDTRESAERAKSEILIKFINTPPPFTLIFDGHGFPDKIYLSGWNTDSTESAKKNAIWISAEELASAYKERMRKWSSYVSETDIAQRDIYVLWTCYSANFSKQFLGLLGNLPKPILIWESEYNQLGIIGKWWYGGNFLENIINLKSGNPTTISTILDGAVQQKSNQAINSTSYIFFPIHRSTLQISELENEYEKNLLA